MSFIIKKFGQIDFCQQNWPNDPRIDYWSFFRLVKLIETYVNLDEEFE